MEYNTIRELILKPYFEKHMLKTKIGFKGSYPTFLFGNCDGRVMVEKLVTLKHLLLRSEYRDPLSLVKDK